jgi:putative ABC transport system substrate-binding protein
MPTVGFMQIFSSPTMDAARDGFTQALADAGYVDGKTVRILYKDAQSDTATLQLIARELVGERVDLIGTASTPALQAALKATTDIPIVFSAVSDPYVAGAGESAEKHRPNVTGVYALQAVDRSLALIPQLLPAARRVGWLYDPADAFTERFQKTARATCAELGLECVEILVTSVNEIRTGVHALQAKGVEVIMQIPTVFVYGAMEGEIGAAHDLGIPVITCDTNHAPMGALATLGWDYFQNGYDAGQLAVRVLKGEKPGAIPIRPIEKEDLVFNLKTAQMFNVTVPDALLQRATRVIQP